MVENTDPKLGLRIIIDSNIFIYAEDPESSGEEHRSNTAEFLRLSSELGFRIVVSAATRSDLLNAPNELRALRLKQIDKYVVLQPIPLDPNLASRAGFPEPRSLNDEADLDVLAALAAGAADWLVTQDSVLRKRATRAGYGEHVFSLSEIIQTLSSLLRKPSSLPMVETVKGYQIDLNAPIFATLKADYPPQGEDKGFDVWWREKVAKEHRDALLLGPSQDPEGIAVLKFEEDQPHGLLGRVLKICTFKISEDHAGSRRGELLLKATIDYARRNRCERTYLEVLPDKEDLVNWLPDFGFSVLEDSTTDRGELVFAKWLTPSSTSDQLSELDFNITHGPGAIRVERIHFVPIRAEWHRRLLPEAEEQMPLFAEPEACGNAIRKAYLCNAPTRQVREGDTLVFLRTRTESRTAATAVGVAEATLVSTVPEEIMAFVGNRTVYTAEEIRELSARREVLAVRFRFDRALSPSWPRTQLQTVGALKSSAQSIQRVREEGIEWIRQQLGG